MIRVNLIGGTEKRAAGAGGSKRSGPPSDRLPLLWAVILLGTLVGGYLWWSGLRTEATRLEVGITTAEARRLSTRMPCTKSAERLSRTESP